MIQATPAYGASVYSAISLQSRSSASVSKTVESSSNIPPQQQSTDDTVILSRQGMLQAAGINQSGQQSSDSKEQTSSPPKGKDGELLTEQEQQKLQKLKLRDSEVKAHEQAHLSTAGKYAAGGASFSFETGPDGAKYAVGGEVPIDMGKEDSPEATIMKMQTVKRAALAPANPSSADRMIAAQADQKAAQARQELMREQNSNTQELLEPDSSLSSQTSTSSDNSVQPQSVEGFPRQTLAINAYKQIAAMIQ